MSVKQDMLEEFRRSDRVSVARLRAISSEFSTVISNLRRDGHVFLREQHEDGSVTYTLERDACICKRRGCGERMPKPSRTGYCGFCIEEKALGLRPHEKLREKVAA